MGDRQDVHMRYRDDANEYRQDVHMRYRDDDDVRRHDDHQDDQGERERSPLRADILLEFDNLCDDFYGKLNDEFSYSKSNDVYLDGAACPMPWQYVKAKIVLFYLDYARKNAPAIVTDYLTRFPNSKPSVLFEGKAIGMLRNNFYAKIKLNDHEEKVLIKKISDIFEKELTRQNPEFQSPGVGSHPGGRHARPAKREDALTKLTTSVASTSVKDIARGNKTNRRNKKMRSKTKKLQPRKKILIGGVHPQHDSVIKKYKIILGENVLKILLSQCVSYIKLLITELTIRLEQISNVENVELLTKQQQIDKILKPALIPVLDKARSSVAITTALNFFNTSQSLRGRDRINLTVDSIFSFSNGKVNKILDNITTENDLIGVIIDDLQALANVEVDQPIDLTERSPTNVDQEQSIQSDQVVDAPTNERPTKEVSVRYARKHPANQQVIHLTDEQVKVMAGLRRRRFKSRNKMYSSRKKSKRKSRRRYKH